jgi:hypothetical protein
MIEVRKLTKYFGTKKAVDEISFTEALILSTTEKRRNSGVFRAECSGQINHYAHDHRLYPANRRHSCYRRL